MPVRRNKTVSERTLKDPNLCKDWKELNKVKARIRKPYKNRKECKDTFLRIITLVKKHLDDKKMQQSQKKKNKMKIGTQRRKY